MSNLELMINKLKETAPRLDFIIQNFHYEKRRDYVRNSYFTKTVKVNTHKAHQAFKYNSWMDQSPVASCIEYIQLNRLNRLSLKITCDFSLTA